MDTATPAVAGAMMTTPLWSTLNAALQTIAVVMGIAWIAMQMYYKFKNERKSK